ncbi:Ger(x)C family spore germination protein [Gottfriedia acidiceleris]|uniref:Ger(x)C family spore germination protein n=1 Tax=Gottfriedia acidiceleris TaxID=371036 RepID=UPI003D23447F
MIRKSLKLLYLFSMLLLVTGCWDTRTIGEKTIINGISFDLDKDNKIEINTLILELIGKGAGVYDFKNELLTAKKDSVYHAGMNLQSYLPGDITTSKTRVFLIGEEFSKVNFKRLIDTFTRKTISNINVELAIVNKQPAKNILDLKIVQNKPLSSILSDTLKAAAVRSISPQMDLHDFYTINAERGIDSALPIIDKTINDNVEVIGTGLLHNGMYTGNFISADQSPLLLMMMGRYGITGNFITTIPENKKIKAPFNTIAYEIIRPRKKLSVSTSKDKIVVNIAINTKVRVNELTTIKILGEEEIRSYIQKDLNKRAQNVIDDIQLANSDVIAIGRYLKEHNPQMWKKLNWEKVYPTIKIHTKVNVSILSTGAIGKESQLEE